MAMTPTEARTLVRAVLAELFPDRDLSALGDRDDLASSLDIDSMALIDIALELERRTGLHVPDEDLPTLTSVQAAVDYLAAHVTR